MTQFYANNLQLQIDERLATIAAAEDVKASTGSWSTPDSRNSTDVLIKNTQPRLSSQLFAALMACWICLGSGASLGYFTAALKSLQHVDSRLPITDGQGSWMASLVMLGAMCGGFLTGPFISLGRKRALWLVSAPLTLAWVLIATASNVALLYAAHTIFGVCLGVVTDATQVYVSESTSPQWRGALGCVPTLMFNVGILVCYLAGAWLDWEQTAVFGAVLTAPAMLLPLAFPESPGFLVAKGRTEEAKAALHWLRGSTWDITAEYDELTHCEKGPRLIERLRGVCNSEILQPLMLTAAVRVLSRFCGLRAILSYIQTILSQSQSNIDVKLATIITGAVQFLATLVACALLDKLGRRKLLIGSQVVMAASLFTLGCYLYFTNDIINENWALGLLPIITILLYIVANAIGLSPASGILIGELIPQRHRSIGSSVTGAISWLSAFVVTKTFLDLQHGLHLYGALWLYGGVCVVGAMFVYYCLPETRGISQYGIEVLFKRKAGRGGGGNARQGVVVLVADLLPEERNCGAGAVSLK